MSDVVTNNQMMVVLEAMRSEIMAVHECFSVLDNKIDGVEQRLTDKIEIVDAKVMGLARRLDSVEERLSQEIADVRSDLVEHRANTEMHRVPKKRALKKVA